MFPWNRGIVESLRNSRLGLLRKRFSEHMRRLRENDTNCIYFFVEVLAFQGFWTVEHVPGTAPWRDHLAYYARYWNSRLLIGFSVYLTLITCPMSAYTNINDELIAVIEPLGFTFIVSFVGVTASTLIYQTNRFKQLLARMREMNRLGMLHRERPEEIVDFSQRMSDNSLNYFLYFVLVILIVCIAQLPEMYQKRLLFFKAWHPFDSQSAPYFHLTLAGMTANAATGYSLVACINALMIALLGQALGQFKLLNHNLRRIRGLADAAAAAAREDAVRLARGALHKHRQHQVPPVMEHLPEGDRELMDAGVTEMTKLTQKHKHALVLLEIDQQMNTIIGHCVRHHQSISRFMEQFVVTFDLILAQQYNMCIVPCIFGVTLFTYSDELGAKAGVYVLLVLASLLDLALYCWLADLLVDQSFLVRDAVFGCDWQDASESFKRSMRIIMSRSNQPLVIRVAGFIPLNMEKFFQVLKMTYSYYMSIVTSYERRLRDAMFMEAFNYGRQNE